MRKCLSMILSILLLSTIVFSQDSSQDRYPAKPEQNQENRDEDQADQEQYQAQYYDNAKVLRVKYSEGETYVQRSYEEGFEEATMNLSIFEKDKVGTTDGRVEIYLGRLNYLRLDYDSEVEFDRAPELRKTDMAIRVSRGGIYLDIQNLDNERDIEIQTPDCGVFLLSKGVYRINVNENGRTNILVHEGMAEVSGDHYSRYVRENQKIVMVDGRVAENPYYFYASRSDEFDRWEKERNSAGGYARYGTSRYLANGYEDYEHELTQYGRWVYYNDYREYIWIPYHIGSSWSPYHNGRWVWNPHYGYVWDSYDHWGYFTDHYGRWQWDNHYGWYWYPGYHWSPAWVYWFWDNDYYGWCPLSRWNRPIIVINNRWQRNHNYRREGIPIHSRSTVIIKRNQVGAPNINKIAVNKATLKKTSFAAKGFIPKERFSTETVKVVNARGKVVTYKKGGFLESHKYEVLKPGVAKNTTKEIEFKYRGSAGKNIEKRAYKYSGTSKVDGPGSPAAQGREIKIEKKEIVTPGGVRKTYKSDNSAKFKEKAISRPTTPEKMEKTVPQEVPQETPKTRYKPIEPRKIETKEPTEPKEPRKIETKETKETKEPKEPRKIETKEPKKIEIKERQKSESSDTSSKSTGTKSSTSTSSPKKIKIKEKEKHYPSFSSSERNYPSSAPNNSDSYSSSYRSSGAARTSRSTSSYGSTPRYHSFQGGATSKYRNDSSSSEKYVPSYRSQYNMSSGRSNSSYPSGSSSRYSAAGESHSSGSSYRGSSASHSSNYNSYSSSRSSSSHSSFSGSSSSGSHSSGSHHSVAVKSRK